MNTLCANEPMPPYGVKNSIHHININPCLNGYIINVGCQAVVFRKGEEALMADEVKAYLVDPEGTTKRYMEGGGV